tara:strand:- start:74 stop:634 length:561 start_codon:yes stop_codon:yes gene_type:complete
LIFTGAYELNADHTKVWKYLNNPVILKNCIDGCKEFVYEDESSYKALILIKLGPINASFKSKIKILNIKEMESYDIEASGNAGQLGFASGKINVYLEKKGLNTLLTYKAEAKINGKIAQLGSRLIDGSVKKNTDLFFNNFKKSLTDNSFSSIGKNKSLNKESNFKLIICLVFLFFIIVILLGIYAK